MGLESLALRLCDTESSTYIRWLRVYAKKRIKGPHFFKELSISLLIASYFGLNNLVTIILSKKGANLEK